MHYRFLRSFFLSTVVASLGTIPFTACTEAGSDGSGDGDASGGGDGPRREGSPDGQAPEEWRTIRLDGGVDLFDCKDSRSIDDTRYRALFGALGFDYLALREEALDGSGAQRTEFELGTKCKTATNQAACLAALDALRGQRQGGLFANGSWSKHGYLVYSKGDEVGKASDRAELLRLLGAIDHPAKAWMVAKEAEYGIPCIDSWVRADGDDYLIVASDLVRSCPVQYDNVLLRVRRDGSYEVIQRTDGGMSSVCIGRMPQGLERPGDDSPSSLLGSYLARAAYLEAASVTAFRILRGELAAHGAPRSLLHAAERAAADEVRHARTMKRLAQRHGATVAKPRVVRSGVRSLEEIAVENACEGCVRETYGALEGTYQARAARDPDVRYAMHAIAIDETRHAALAHRVAAWLDTRLSTSERARVHAAKQVAIRDLSVDLARERSPAISLACGLPSKERATELLASLGGSLWGRSAA